MSRPQRILIVTNNTKAQAASIGEQLAAAADESGWRVHTTSAFPLSPRDLDEVDLCVVVGGDGSLLGVVQAVAQNPVPVMGVNLGTLGFMANFSAEAAVEELREVLHHPHPTSARSLIEVTAANGERRWALNDVVVKAAGSHLARVSVAANGQFVNAYNADGLIIASPTGSTAYNLSAGGPILHPEVKAMVVTPINPHTLTNRAIVLDDDADLSITLQAVDTAVQISADGTPLAEGREHTAFPLRVRISRERCFPLLQPLRVSAFDLLRKRLRWMGETPSRSQTEEP
jgi:NAD+ kinase